MKSIVFLVVSLVAASGLAMITCQGKNPKGEMIQLQITENGYRSVGYKLVDLKKVVRNKGVEIPGCSDALFAGLEDNVFTLDYSDDLIIECSMAGDSGYLELNKTGPARYSGEFTAPNGKAILGLRENESLSLSCSGNL